MSADVLITYQGLPVFFRSYGQQKLDDYISTAGFFEAILTFSTLKVGESLETISMSDSLFHFYSKNGFAFVLKEPRASSLGTEQITAKLKELATAFLIEFPAAANWAGDVQRCGSFAATCDRILKVPLVRRGFPVLFRIMVKPFFITPVLQVMPVSIENEESMYELQYYLKQSIEGFGRKNRLGLIHKPFLIYLPRTRRIAYIYAFHLGLRRVAITHLLCFIADERDWFEWYQLMSLFSRRAKYISPEVAEYLHLLESNPLADEVQQHRRRVQEIISSWADLNQYINVMHVILSEEFFKAGIASENMSAQRSRQSFFELIRFFGSDFEKVLNAALSLEQVLFVSRDRQRAEKAIGALLNYYPHPSVTIWTEEPSDSLFVGTTPDLALFYGTESVVVDLDGGKILNGRKNEFCRTLLKETLQFAPEMSISESRLFFQGKISAIFSLVKGFLEVLTHNEEKQHQCILDMLQRYPEDSIELVYQIARNVNKLLAKILRQTRTSLILEAKIGK